MERASVEMLLCQQLHDTGCPPLIEHGHRVPTCDSYHLQEVPDKRDHPHSRGDGTVGRYQQYNKALLQY